MPSSKLEAGKLEVATRKLPKCDDQTQVWAFVFWKLRTFLIALRIVD